MIAAGGIEDEAEVDDEDYYEETYSEWLCRTNQIQ